MNLVATWILFTNRKQTYDQQIARLKTTKHYYVFRLLSISILKECQYWKMYTVWLYSFWHMQVVKYVMAGDH